MVADLPLDAVATGHRTGPRTPRRVYPPVLRELAHRCGHADILREQVLAAPAPGSPGRPAPRS
jgi:hypothetical protein